MRRDDLRTALGPAASIDALDAGAGDRYYHDAASGLIHLKAMPGPGRVDATYSIDPR